MPISASTPSHHHLPADRVSTHVTSRFSGTMLLAAAVLISCSTTVAVHRSTPRVRPSVELSLHLTQSLPELRSPAAPASYPDFYRLIRSGPALPGLIEGAVPQGLAYWREQGLIVISAYFEGSAPSAVMAVDLGTGRLAKTLWLADTGGQPMHGHVGGVAVSPSCLWIASDAGVFRYPLHLVAEANDGGVLRADAFFPTLVVASSATYSDGVLWVGEFAYYGPGAGQYTTASTHHLTAPDGELHHALAAGYRIDPQTRAIDGPHPDYLLSIPDRVQGLAFAASRLFLSHSYGRRNDSTLEAYRNPLDRPAAGELHGVPLWFLDRENRESVLIAPPMMEGITPVDGRLTLLFESAAEKYRYSGRAAIDHLLSLDLREAPPQ